ncbi:MAG: type II toxin-antitoxin system PemK/MazF family toxin [PS1 clade bacterium]|uniref:Type II toxin-antitoxin system PemK/MazF family toxin n=1 Tax=PS1 clade bacterium TaxID=2175152 RepID=A0A937L755_9PROT|nr:type II toxin-antitoxin system PemK/MazF family toxin [PS1 clade bacterium]
MAINFYPRAGQIFICDFSHFSPPEMTKKRPIIIVSPRLKNRAKIVTIVPLSTTAPRVSDDYTVLLSKDYDPNGSGNKRVWAKCDMVLNIGTHRLNSYKIGRRKYFTPETSGDDLERVRRGVLAGLGFR